MKKNINVKGTQVSVLIRREVEYLSLTDMLRAKDGNFFIADWLRNRNTLEFLGVWERINNPNFNYGEFAIIKSKAGLNSFKISVKEWVEKTKAIGLRANVGRYGGTYAQSDIAIEFSMWISAEFKVFLIKEFQRLKKEESEKRISGWDIKRMLARINYKVHTDAIKENLIPRNLEKFEIDLIYASEADVLNMALYGLTAKQWKEQNPNKEGNIRDNSDVVQLVCLAGLESLNAEFIRQGFSQDKRVVKLNEIAIIQMKSLLSK